MNQIMLAAVNRIIVGPAGRRIPAYGSIHAAYTLGLYANYYRYNPTVSVQTIYKYANHTTRYPHFWAHHYAGSDGYRRNLSDMMGIAGMLIMIPISSVFYTLLREITQKRVTERGIDPEKLRDHPPELKSKFKEKRERKKEQKLLKQMKDLAAKHAEKHPKK